MAKRFLCLGMITFVMIFIVGFTYIYTHPGRTDSNGGHYDHDTGGYHYHHGYPAHQHPGGICPYNSYNLKNDNNFHNSNSSENNTNTVSSEENDFFNEILEKLDIVLCFFVVMFGPACIGHIFKVIKEHFKT